MSMLLCSSCQKQRREVDNNKNGNISLSRQFLNNGAFTSWLTPLRRKVLQKILLSHSETLFLPTFQDDKQVSSEKVLLCKSSTPLVIPNFLDKHLMHPR